MKMGDKVIVYGYIDGYSYETTGQTNYIIALETGERVEIPLGVAINADEIVFKDNIKLKDVIKRIKGFDNGTKFKWTYDILKELGSDFASKIFHEGYQQGRFDEAVETHHEPEKVTVPQFMADWIEEARKACKDVAELFEFDFTNDEVGEWFMQERPFDLVARAWLDGYEVEEEKRYIIKLKGVPDGAKFLKYTKVTQEWYFGMKEHYSDKKIRHTRKQLEQAGFGWVFDCEGIEVEEVTE